MSTDSCAMYYYIICIDTDLEKCETSFLGNTIKNTIDEVFCGNLID